MHHVVHEIMKKALPESIIIPDAIPFSRSISHFSQILHLRKQVKLFPSARTSNTSLHRSTFIPAIRDALTFLNTIRFLFYLNRALPPLSQPFNFHPLLPAQFNRRSLNLLPCF